MAGLRYIKTSRKLEECMHITKNDCGLQFTIIASLTVAGKTVDLVRCDSGLFYRVVINPGDFGTAHHGEIYFSGIELYYNEGDFIRMVITSKNSEESGMYCTFTEEKETTAEDISDLLNQFTVFANCQFFAEERLSRQRVS